MHKITSRLLPHCHRAYSSDVQGWVTSIAKTGSNAFVKIDEGKGKEPVQVLVQKEMLKELKVKVGCAISASGSFKVSQGAKQQQDFVAKQLQVVGTDENPRYDGSSDTVRKDLTLRARNPRFAALMRARSAIFRETHEFFMSRDFVHIDTPKITDSDCEGGGEVFDVVSEPAEYLKSKSAEGSDGYQPTYLTVSSQLHLEAMVSRLGNVYTLGPAFRAEKQQSHTHLSEFHMLEAEVAFVSDTEKLCDIVEAYLNHMIATLHTSPILQSSIKTMNTEIPKPPTHINRISFNKAVEQLTSAGEKVTAKSGLSRKNELKLIEITGMGPIFVTDFPTIQKPFYMARNEEETTTKSFDLLVPGIGELAGGSIREPNVKELEKRCNINWYNELRRRGQPPTGGFGIGFERLLQYLLGIHNIKDTIAFPRTYRHIRC